MLDKKQIWAIFLFEFKIGHTVKEITRNINDAFGPGTAKACTSRCFKKFCKDESLEDEELSGQPTEVDNNREPSPKLILLQLHEKLPKNSTFNHPTVICQLKQIGKVKNLLSGCLVS